VAADSRVLTAYGDGSEGWIGRSRLGAADRPDVLAGATPVGQRPADGVALVGWVQPPIARGHAVASMVPTPGQVDAADHEAGAVVVLFDN